MVDVVLRGSRVNEDVVYEHHHELIQVRFKDPVHKVYEGCRGIGEAKGHHHKLVVSISGTEHSPGYIHILNSELVVPRTAINFRKGSRALQLVE